MRRVVSLVRSAPVALRDEDPVLEANAYGLSEAIDLTVVLAGAGVELALGAAEAPAGDLRGLLESGVPVYADAHDLKRRGIRGDDLVAGVGVLAASELAEVLGAADTILSW